MKRERRTWRRPVLPLSLKSPGGAVGLPSVWSSDLVSSCITEAGIWSENVGLGLEEDERRGLRRGEVSFSFNSARREEREDVLGSRLNVLTYKSSTLPEPPTRPSTGPEFVGSGGGGGKEELNPSGQTVSPILGCLKANVSKDDGRRDSSPSAGVWTPSSRPSREKPSRGASGGGATALNPTTLVGAKGES